VNCERRGDGGTEGLSDGGRGDEEKMRKCEIVKMRLSEKKKK